MKALITAVALAALAATPALAQTYHRAPAPNYDANYGPGYEAYGSAAPQGYQGNIVGSSPVATFEGRVVGQDPDINVRQQLERDPGGVAQ